MGGMGEELLPSAHMLLAMSWRSNRLVVAFIRVLLFQTALLELYLDTYRTLFTECANTGVTALTRCVRALRLVLLLAQGKPQ